jgi:hypothetical protein
VTQKPQENKNKSLIMMITDFVKRIYTHDDEHGLAATQGLFTQFVLGGLWWCLWCSFCGDYDYIEG